MNVKTVQEIRRSESDLVVFISSRQTPDMTMPRQEAQKAVESFPNCRVWAFENMPPSSENARDRYVQSVAVSDFVIWLVGEETTQPILDEIHTCINTEGRLLAFILPNKASDAQTQSLIQAAEEYATWKKVDDLNDLYEIVKAALSDEINRLIHNPVPRGREQKLRELRRESIARCKRYFTTLGVSDSIAEEMAASHEFGYSPPIPEAGVVKIVGVQGVGKTLAGERVLQGAIDNAIRDSSQPFPVFVRARDLDNRPLSEFLESAIGDHAAPSIQGALVVIDGLDEVGITSANRILDDAAVYTTANSKAVAVVTTRQMPGLKQDVGSDAVVPQLTDSEALMLISKVSERGFDKMYLFRLAEPLKDVAHLPLFAIMIGSELGNNSNFAYPTQTHLIAQVARRALQSMGDRTEDMEYLLQQLAIKVIHNKGGIAKTEVHHREAVRNELLNTRLIAEESNKLDFTLSVFREWFGARAIIERELSFDQMKPEIEQWVIPITIAMRSEDEDLGISLMGNLAATDPGTASKVLDELDDTRFIAGRKNPPIDETSQELGLAIRKAMEDWGVGIGSELMRKIGPVDENGALYPLGISVNSNWVNISWYEGTKDLEPIVDAPDFDRYGSDGNIDLGWRSEFGTTVKPTKYWPWVLTKGRLVDSLNDEMKCMLLSIISIDAVRELSYDFARKMVGRKYKRHEEISVKEVLAFTHGNLHDTAYLSAISSYYDNEELLVISSYFAKKLTDGEIFIKDPWPGPDRTLPAGKTSWRRFEDYSDERLLERVVAIFEAALRIYRDMTATYFKNLGTSPKRRIILQSKLEGRMIIPSSYDSYRDSPVLTWWPRYAEDDEQSRIDFQLEYEDGDTHDRIRRVREVAISENLERFGVSFSHQGMLPSLDRNRRGFDFERPATELAYKWLNDDLRDIGWAR